MYVGINVTFYKNLIDKSSNFLNENYFAKHDFLKKL